MCSDNPPTCYYYRRAEEERQKAAALTNEDHREFQLILADIFHTRHVMSGADDEVYDRFSVELQSLHGDEILRRKLAFDRLPRPAVFQRELRLAQHLCLVAALINEFGRSEWQPALERFRAENPSA